MASFAFSNGLSIHSQAISSSPLLQGGDSLNLTVNISYSSQENFTSNSTACRRLPGKQLDVQGIIILPLFLKLLSSINRSKEITSDLSNCSFIPTLDISMINYANASNSFFNISSSNVSWTLQLFFSINVTSDIPPDSWINITTKLLIAGEYTNLTLARFKSIPISDFFVTSNGTSLPETPLNELTLDETVNYGITMIIPSITTELILTMVLPTLGGQTPMKWSHTIVTSIAPGLTTERLNVGSAGQLYVGEAYRSSFPFITNVAKLNFGKTSNIKSYQNNSVSIGIDVEAKVLQSERFIPGNDGNITFELAYQTLNGMRHIGPIYNSLNLSQPPLSCVLEVVGGPPHYQGNDLVKYNFRIENPQFSTESAENITVAFTVQEDVVIQDFSANICSEFHCSPLRLSNFNSSVKNSAISRLNVSSSIHGNLTLLLRPSVIVGSNVQSDLTLSYTRPSWISPALKTMTIYIPIRQVHFSGPYNINSSVLSPNDNQVIIPGEDVTYQLKMMMPVSRSSKLVIVFRGEGTESIGGHIIGVGVNIQSDSNQPLPGMALNITQSSEGLPINVTSPIAMGVFHGLSNNGSSSLPGSAEISFQTTVRAFDALKLDGKEFVSLMAEAYVNSEPMPQRFTFKLKIIKPELQVHSSITPTNQVKPQQVLSFSVTLSHTQASTSHAYGVLLEIAVPHQYLTLNVGSIQPQGAAIRVVNGHQAPSRSSRYNDSLTKVLVYQVDTFPLPTPPSKNFTMTYAASTVSNLPSSIFIQSPMFLSYTILPNKVVPHNGGLYNTSFYGAKFYTFRPPPYVQAIYTSSPRVLDAGDKVAFDLTVKHNGNASDTPPAYNLQMTLKFPSLDNTNVSVNCNKGSPSLNLLTSSGLLVIGDLLYGQSFYCNITGRVVAQVSPNQDISPVIQYTYYPTTTPRLAQSIHYHTLIRAHTLIAAINTTVTASPNAQRLLAGEDLDFSLRLLIPECVTQLALTVTMPTLSLVGTGFERQRRSILIHDKTKQISGRVRRSVNAVDVVRPLLNESSTSTDVNSNLTMTSPSPNITRPNTTTLKIDFGSVQKAPTPLQSFEGITIYLKFRSAYLPLVLSGRDFVLTALLNYTGGELNLPVPFTIIGPLVKPLLVITKSVQVNDSERDSPLLFYNVTVTHSQYSQFDAHDLVIQDNTKNMNIQRSSVLPINNVFVSYPDVHTYNIRLVISKLAVGESVSLSYKASFLIKEKDEKQTNLPATVTWKSIQINSPIYSVSSNLTACVSRFDTNRWKTKEVTGFFALGVLLGLLLGIILAIIIIVLIIKCCDKGKIASCYSRFTNKDSMTVLTGGAKYVLSGEDDPPDKKLVARHNEPSIVKTDESIVPILSLDKSSQTDKELDSLDLQATADLEVEIEIQRHNMFVDALSLLVKKLRVKRHISSSQEKKFLSSLKAELGSLAYKISAEFKRKSAEITKRIRNETKIKIKVQAKRQANERHETENKIKGLVSARERNEIMELLRKRHAKEEEELRKKAKLDLDVELEKLRKEISVGKRFATKECQSKFLQDLIKEARFNEEHANDIVREHMSNMAAVERVMAEERSRRLVALEMRLAERQALALQKHEDERHNQVILKAVGDHQDESLENLVRSSKLSDADAAAYREQYRKEMEALDKKLQKERQKQAKHLHTKLTALKQKRMQDKVQKHQEQLRKLKEEEDDKFEQVEIDCISTLEERRQLTLRQRKELEELEKTADKEAALELQKLYDRQSKEAQDHAEMTVRKICKDMASKGLEESESIVNKHISELAQQQEIKEEQRRQHAQLLEKRLSKLRKALEKKAQEDMEEQEDVREKEQQIVNDLIVSQVVMSEEERDKIIAEHEKNMAEQESSLTLNKLRQRQKLEEKLAEKRKRKMEELERKQQEEEQFKDYGDKIINEGEDIELLKKHEQQRVELLKEDDQALEEEMDQVREEMMNERAKRLEEHQENLSATIAKLQIEKAKRVSRMAIQQQMLNQLQTNLVDELESQGALKDPETHEIVEKYKKDAKKVEDNLRNQRKKQEEDLRARLHEKMKQREQTMLLENQNKYSRYLEDGSNKTALRFRKAAMKAKQEKEMENLRKMMEKQIEQSLSELKLNQELQLMKKTEEKNVKFIAALVDKGQLKEEELESVLKFLFPNKPPEYIDTLLERIYGTNHPGTSSSFNSGEMSQLEVRVRRSSVKPSQIFQSSKKKKKNSKLKEEEEYESILPPVVRSRERRPISLEGDQSSTLDSPKRLKSLPMISSISQQATSPGNEEDQRLLDEMFGDASEVEFRKPSRGNGSRRSDR
ncbi:uncharacterized protein LOC116297218 [Actinia tenebrosa]|uniref:Uncharacterized protein LOC116297218 n=1 Tax=Actinia tenebrosa TaxID=6105 RepID=A0A6P8I869_ACTTE|nr:uncharacterized protein LOC116297218 [Actinia tenebrosa]